MSWLDGQVRTSACTREIYEAQLRLYVLPAIDDELPALGEVALNALTSDLFRSWYAALRRKKSASVASKSYTRLRQILASAVDDDRLAKNPCRIEAGGAERHREQRVASLIELYQVADAVPDRNRALVRTSGLAGLRQGELLALRVANVDLLRDRNPGDGPTRPALPDAKRKTIGSKRGYRHSDRGGVDARLAAPHEGRTRP